MKTRSMILAISVAAWLNPRVQATTFEIAGGNAAQSLNEWSQVSGLTVFYDFGIISKLRTNAARGEMDPLDALIEMLRGTGLSFDAVNDHALVVIAEPYPLCRPELAARAPLPPCAEPLVIIIVTATRGT